MQKLVIVIPLMLILSACATTFDPRACPQERIYTKAEQQKLLAALKKSPVVIQGAMVDYGKLRDMVRACRGAR